jgi:hypothetical protein
MGTVRGSGRSPKRRIIIEVLNMKWNKSRSAVLFIIMVCLMWPIVSCTKGPKSAYSAGRGYPYWQSSVDIFAEGMALDDAGNLYICGSFRGKVDFDQGPGTVMKESKTNRGGYTNTAFLLKLGPSHDFQWVITDDNKYFQNLAINGDKLFIVGHPGIGLNNTWGGFLSRFDLDGKEQWTKTWGEHHEIDVSRLTIAIDGSRSVIHVCGSFGGKSSFQTSTSPKEFQSVGSMDGIYLIFDFDGNCDMASVRPGRSDLTVTDGPVELDDAGNTLFLTNEYYGEHFDTIAQTSLTKLYGKGESQWAKTWDGGKGKTSFDNFVTDTSGNLYVIGYTTGGTDLDPGPGSFVPPDTGSKQNGVMIKLDPSGEFLWGDVWGGPPTTEIWRADVPYSICLAGSEVWVSGPCNYESNLYPSKDGYQALAKDLAKDLRPGHRGGYISRFNSDGVFKQAYVEADINEIAHLIAGKDSKAYAIQYFTFNKHKSMLLMVLDQGDATQ